MEREQIIKALECCKTPLASDCENCSYTGKRLEDGVYEGCVNILVGDALSLIKELTEENERLQKALSTDISIVRVSRGGGKTAHLREVGRIKAASECP